MFFRSIFALSLIFISNASLIPKGLDASLDSRTSAATQTNVLGPVARLRIMNDFVTPDGHNRSASLVNGLLPAPLIRANKGDHFAIEVVNDLTDDSMGLETSIHFHGMFQHKSNWADGSAYISQCPLRQEETFIQKFSPTGQTGTYWYHSHYESERCHGAQGPLVIYDPEDPLAHLYDVDDENTIISLSNWYHSPHALSQFFVFPNSTLINGKGRYPGGPAAPLSVISVQQGLRYRFRVIGMSCDGFFNFTIDGHRMTIIEVDGTEINPVEVDSIPIYGGQRYSVVVAADQPIGSYWIRSLSSTPNSTFDDGQSMAILRYEGAAEEDPTSEAGPYELSFDEGDLHPLFSSGVPGIPEIGMADVNLVLSSSYNPEAGEFIFGNMSYAHPTVPVLLQILSGARNAWDLLPHGSVYTLPPNKVIEISFPNPVSPGAPHPVHLHGHTFDVIRGAGSNRTNFVDPIRRDVVSLGDSPTDNVTIRFVTDNPGPWLLHCHLDWHFNHGFAVVLAEAPDEIASQETPVVPEDWKKLCQNQY